MKLAYALAALVACKSGEEKEAESTAKPGKDDAFHALDRATSQGFRAAELAVGGGFVYWVDQPRIDRNGLGKSVIERKPSSGGEVGVITEPSDVYAIAADG